MNIIKTPFEGLLVIEPKIHSDSRGYFFESFNKQLFKERGITFECLQENQSRSKKNVIRGLHYQRLPHAQTKLIRVVHGRILDVVVDLRKSQHTYKKTFSIELSADSGKQLLIPKGFAHGYSVYSDSAEIVYCCDDYYHPDSGTGILYNDTSLDIDWKVNSAEAIVSEKDLQLPTLSASENDF